MPTIAATCPTCKNEFESKRPKRFCSVKCRAQSPEFIEVAKRNAEKARAARSQAKGRRKCQNEACGKEFDCEAARATRFCSRSCWRENRAALFDAHVADLDIEKITNFDQFLAVDRLECSVKGCSWVGHGLGHHLVEAHGIRAADFKRIAGFNNSTGLVSKTLAKKLSERVRDLQPLSKRGRGPAKGKSELRPEARAHYEQAMLIRRAEADDGCPAAAPSNQMDEVDNSTT